jgi:acyl carrier protein
MDEQEIRSKLTSIFRDVFDDESLEISDQTTAKDVEDWDSLSHINLIVAAERAFKVKFTTREVQSLANVGDFIRLIARRTSR